jgi:hypothetical protein
MGVRDWWLESRRIGDGLWLHSFLSRAINACTWKTMHLVKLQHLDLPNHFGLTSTSRWVELIFLTDFPSGPRPCCLGLPFPIIWPNHRLHMVQGLSAPQLTPQAPFLKPWLINTYATYEHVNLGVKPNPTFRLITQARHKGYPMVV